MVGRTVGFDHARGAGAWFSASPRVQRLVGAQVAVLLAAGVGGVLAHRVPGTGAEPLALATAVGPVGGGPVAVVDPPPAGSVGRIEVSRSEHRPVKATPTARSKRKRPSAPAPPKGRYGVDHASDATPEQQEAAAADLYRRHGTADWAASAPCWRAPKDKQ